MNELNFNPFPELKTDRFLLRNLNISDSYEIFLLHSDETVNKYLDRNIQSNIVEAEIFIAKINDGIRKNKWIYWAISSIEKQNLIGTVCLWNFSENNNVAEIGYELIPKYFGKGIMHEALKSVIDYGFEILNLTRIEAFTHKDNNESIKLLLKNNFYLDENRKDKNNKNHIIFLLERENFNNHKQSIESGA